MLSKIFPAAERTLVAVIIVVKASGVTDHYLKSCGNVTYTRPKRMATQLRLKPGTPRPNYTECLWNLNIIISILKPVFLYRGLGLFDKSSSKTSSPLRTVHRVSKIHSKLLSVIHQHFIPGFLRPAASLLCNYT